MSEGAWRTHRGHDPRNEPLLSRRALLVAGAMVVTTGAAWAYQSDSTTPAGDTEGPLGTDGVRQPSPTPTTPPTTSPETVPTTTVGPPEVPPLTHSISDGMVGLDVERLQRRLTDVAFDPGPIDGVFGPATLRSVWAFEKLVLGVPRTDITGVITPDSWKTLFGDVTVAPRRTPGGTHMEVYLPEQVSVLFIDGRPSVISHVSSGEGIVWCDEVEIDLDDGTTELKGICGKSVTPGGVYRFDRKVEGWRNAKLGRLYQPIYFNYGIAIHGATNVPAYPASRGCVRHPMHIAEYLPDLIALGDTIYVFDGVEEPETYGAQPMIFDWPDPDWIPPSTTTSTTTTTTVPPSTTTTTVPAPTTPVAPATTTPTTTTAPPTTSTLAPPPATAAPAVSG